MNQSHHPDERPVNGQADLAISELLILLLHNRARIVLWAVIPAVLVTLWVLASPRTYTAHTMLTPVAGQQAAGRLTSLAAQFGVAGMLPDGGDSPDYIVDVVTAPEMLEALVLHEYHADVPSRWPFGIGQPERVSGNMVTFYDLDTAAAVRQRSIAKAVRRLRKDISASSRLESGVVSISVRMESRELAEQILNELLAKLDEHNRVRRQSRAGAERKFVAERLATAEEELRSAEAELTRFLERNRSFEGSPALRFRYESLSREVGLRHDVVRTLAQSFEQARIEEVRATPVYTVVSAPSAPTLPDRRHTVMKLLASLLVGAIGGVFATLVASVLEKERLENPRLAADWNQLRKSLWTSHRRPKPRLSSNGET